MKRPKVILHDSISLDGSLLGFEVDMEAHYRIAGQYAADVHLVGSNTIAAGVRLFCPQVPAEEPADFHPPNRDPQLPLWAVVDTAGKLQGLHHVARRMEYCRDVVVLVSRKTPAAYLRYLADRRYDFHVVGEDHIDCARALDLLAERYGARTVLTDTGQILNCALLNLGLVDEISLLVHPVVVGKTKYPLLDGVAGNVRLALATARELPGGKVWLNYTVAGSA